jgi:2-isopropylmalate synthase
MSKKVAIFDSSLRDGAQAEGISFSVEDKLKILELLDGHGIDYIEAGNPGSNPKDLEFFARARAIALKHAKLAAFGSTRRRDIKVEQDSNVQSLLLADTPVIVIFGKSWDFHVTDIIRTTLEENLAMIARRWPSSRRKGKEVVYDAEHFFDGYKHNPAYAVKRCRRRSTAVPIARAVRHQWRHLPVGDRGHRRQDQRPVPGHDRHSRAQRLPAWPWPTAWPRSRTVRGTCRAPTSVSASAAATPTCRRSSPISASSATTSACRPTSTRTSSTWRAMWRHLQRGAQRSRTVVGNSAFAHKGGMHIDGVNKASHSFEHINPELVGGQRRFLMSEVSGPAHDPRQDLGSRSERHQGRRGDRPHHEAPEGMEHEGYQFEGAESTFELLVSASNSASTGRSSNSSTSRSSASSRPTASTARRRSSRSRSDGVSEITAAEGDGPVHALDSALRKALDRFYPELANVHLTDYKVRVINGRDATATRRCAC